MIPLSAYLYISAALFCIGTALVITKKNVIVVLMGIELMLNAANINLVAFSQLDEGQLQGQFFALFVIVVAAAEVAVALAIVIKTYQHYQSSDLKSLNQLKD